MQGAPFSELPPDRPTVFYREDGHSRVMRRIAPLRMLLTICLSVSACLLGWTVATRPQPFEPALVYFGVCVVPLGLYVLHHSTVRNLRTLKVFLLLATLYGAPFLAWNTAAYRGVVFALTWWALPDQSLMRTLDDRSDWVGAMGCERALRAPTFAREEAVLPVLQFRPGLAERCLRGVGQRHPELGHKLSRQVTRRWYRAWMNSSILPSSHGCEAARVFTSVSSHRGDNGAAQLLHCALAAEQQAVGKCCTEALERDFSAAQIPQVHPRRLEESTRAELFYLVNAQLHQSEGTGLLQDRGWLLHWTATLGCHLVDGDERPHHMAAELALMTRRQCGFDVQDTLFPSETTRLMRRSCEPINSEEWFGQIAPREWCSRVRHYAVQTAVEAASFRIAQSVAKVEVRGLARGIHQGVARRESLKYGQGPLTLAQLRGNFDDGMYGSDIVGPRRYRWLETPAADDRRDRGSISVDHLTEQARAQSASRRKGGDEVRARQLDTIVDVLESRRRESASTSTTMEEAFRRFETSP
jgi:hypothetical protein